MTLICSTLTHSFAVLSGDTMVTLNGTPSTTDKKVFKFHDLLIGASGSGGAIEILPTIMRNYQGRNAFNQLDALARLFRETETKVEESRYSQFLYLSKEPKGPFMGVVDTKGDHQILKLEKSEPFLIYHGIGEPNSELLNNLWEKSNFDFNKVEDVQKLHERYIDAVSKKSNSVNSIVNHEILFY